MEQRNTPWEGFMPAVVTPFKEDGSIDEGAYKRNIARFLAEGVGGIVATGHNGEEWAITDDEKTQLWTWARETIAAEGYDVPVIAGIDAVSNHQLVEEAKHAEAAGVDGVMITPPFYLATVSETELYARFEAVSRAVPLPIVVYNNPRRTGINLDPRLTGRLAELDTVKGVKESMRDFVHLSETIRNVGDNARVYVGPCSLILPGVILGAKGYISTGPDLLGQVGVDYYQIIKRHDFEKARQIHYQLVPLYAMLNRVGTWPASLKVALDLTGKEGGLPRDPIRALTPEQVQEVRGVLEQLQILPTAVPAD